MRRKPKQPVRWIDTVLELALEPKKPAQWPALVVEVAEVVA